MKNIATYQALLLLISLTSSSKLFAQDTTRLSVEEILVQMDTSYPALLQYNLKLQAIQARTQGAASWMPPTVSVGFDRWGYQPSMWNEQSPMNQAGIMISAEQMFPNPQKLSARTNAVAAQSAPLQYDSALLKNNLRLQARIYYYQRLIAERKLAIVQQSIAVIDLLIVSAEAKYSVNQSDISSVFKAKAKRAELVNMQAMLLSEIASSNIGLNTLMNRDVNTVFLIDTVIVLQALPDSIAFDSISNRSDIAAINAGIYSMRGQQQAMRSEKLPDFGVRFTHMQMFGMPNQFSVMGMMVIPLAPWSSPMYDAEVRAMEFEIREMELEKETMQLMAQQMSAERLSMWRFEKQQLNNYDSLIIPAYQDNYDAAFLAWKNNTGSFYVLLDAWEMLLMKKLEAENQLLKVVALQTQFGYEMEK